MPGEGDQSQNNRWWDQRFNKFIKEGGEEPGDHPDPNHLWNKDRDAYMAQARGETTGDDGEAEGSDRDQY